MENKTHARMSTWHGFFITIYRRRASILHDGNGIYVECWCSSRWRISLHLPVDRELRFNINQYWNNQSICMPTKAPRMQNVHKSIEPHSSVISMRSVRAHAKIALCVQSRACTIVLTLRRSRVQSLSPIGTSQVIYSVEVLHTVYNLSNSHQPSHWIWQRNAYTQCSNGNASDSTVCSTLPNEKSKIIKKTKEKYENQIDCQGISKRDDRTERKR